MISGRGLSRRGYTLLEVLVTLALAAILVGIAGAPLYGRQRATQLLRSTAMELSNDLRDARFAAIREGMQYNVEVGATSYLVRARAPGAWHRIKTVSWPSGVSRSSNVIVVFKFLPSGLFPELDNNTITLKNKQGDRISVIISSGGRIRIE